MSTATHEPSAIRQCRNKDCTVTKYWGHLYQGEYCTPECKTEHDGHKALKPVKHDHCICFTCGTRLKVVYRPERGFGVQRKWPTRDGEPVKPAPKNVPDNYIGNQSPRPEATWGEKAHPKNDRYVRTGAVCDYCGNTDHRERIAELWQEYPDAYAKRILDRVNTEGETLVDRDAFWDAYDGANFEYAVGKAAGDA